jgi:2-dehydro-3-deoxyglucarate aldolase/4-hydroxy-2-oxoheptanedioate aldolase
VTLSFKDRLQRRDRLIGTVLTLPVTELAEICCDAGFDWLFLDMEHGLLGIPDVQRICQVVAGRCACLVRVPANEDVWIKKALDIGVNGIIVPLVNTSQEAAKSVLHSKYPPEGARSVGITRAHGYGANFQGYVESANQQTVVVVQVEHIESVDNIDKILQVAGVDAVFVGPYDLSASLGKTGQISDPEVQSAVARVRTACIDKNFPSGIFAWDPSTAKVAIEDGYTLVAVGMDILLFSSVARQVVAVLK